MSIDKRDPSTHRTKRQQRAASKADTALDKAKRAARGRARYAAEKAGKVSKGDGKDIAHKKGLVNAKSKKAVDALNKKGNTKVQSAAKNRGHGSTKGRKLGPRKKKA